MGEILFEAEAGAHATSRAVQDHAAYGQQGLFKRRLSEARAVSQACNGLNQAMPQYSARGGLWPGQRSGLWAAAGVAIVLAILEPAALQTTVTFAVAGVFTLLIVARLVATAFAPFTNRKANPSKLPDSRLPSLTVLVPLYREGAVVGSLVKSLAALDYPSDRLDIKLLLEGDDDETLQALVDVALPGHIEILPIPPCDPRTKPKALNYGLEHAQGEFVVVFDAEDRPSPGQPREAMAAFARGGRDLAVVQAPLLIDNARDSWLSRQFELEYAIHFLVWLPFLAKIKAPIALGGTSNYFRRRQLEDAGGWDAWNVTEDADLGLRLARFGREAAMITLPTWEEAPSRPGEWMKQRTRWMKGHLQTWLVASRAPFSGKQRFNPGEFLSIQMTLGGSLLASLLHGPLLVWLIYGLATQQAALQGWHLGLFAAGYVGVLLAALAALGKPRLTALLLLPLYWPLLSIAMLRALWEMKTRPQFWAKTQHGFSRTRPVQQVINTPVHETPLDNVIQLDFGF